MKKVFYIYLVIVSVFFVMLLFINNKKRNENYKLEGFYYENNEYLVDNKMKIDLFFNKENISFKEIEKNEYFLVGDNNVKKIVCSSVKIKNTLVVFGTLFYHFCFEFYIEDEINQKCNLQIKNDLEELEICLSSIETIKNKVIYEINDFYYVDEKLLFKGVEIEKIKYLDEIYEVKKVNQYYEIENIKLDIKNVFFDANGNYIILLFSLNNNLDFKKIERIVVK